MAPNPEEIPVNWEKVAKSFQIENEMLRAQMQGYTMGRDSVLHRGLPFISLNIKDVVSWIEAHPMTAAVIVYVVSTILMDLAEIISKRR